MKAQSQIPRFLPWLLLAALVVVFALSALIDGRSEASTNSASYGEAPPATPFEAKPKRYHYPKAGTRVYFFKPLYVNRRRCTFAFERLPSGAVRFIDAYDHREYCLTPPFEMEERPLPASATEAPPPADVSEKEQRINERLKCYVVTSFATFKGHRYSTFKYSIDAQGTLHFESHGNRMAIAPPFLIEEDFVAAGNRPKIPEYPPQPDRG